MTPHPAHDAIAGLLAERTGLSFSPSRRDGAELGIRRAMARAGLADVERYRDLIAHNAAALDDLIVEPTVGETYFFREPAQFAFIRREVLPDLRRRLGSEPWFRAWSAGCASGEEAYSLAILFEEEGLGERAFLLGTDVSRAALAKARQAVYGTWSLRGESAGAAHRYLRAQGNRFVLAEHLRRRVVFDYLNLALDTYPSFAAGTWGMHLILCRNVLIYFDRDTVRAVARRLHESLAPGGWLIAASSDPPLAGDAPYETVLAPEGVFYRRRLGPIAFPVRGSLESTAETAVARQLSGATAVSAVGPALPGQPVPPAPARPKPRRQPLPSAPPEAPVPLTEPLRAFAEGDYARAAELTRSLTTSADASALRVRALSNLDSHEALRACEEVTARHPLATELHYLHAVLLLSLGREEDAARAVRRVLYLDRSLAIAHFTLGSILQRAGNLTAARLAYRNARDLAAARPAGEPVPLGDGGSAGRLAETAAMQLALLDATSEETS